jgi:aryl-alcohol dehydrogenase-like predicted oxidoreductase
MGEAMPLRRLGKTGPEVSALGVGAMSFAEFYGPTTEENSLAILDAALEHGVSHIDTANVYGMGRSEEAIGRFLKERGPGTRDRFVIATKAAISRDAEGRRCFDNSAAHLEQELDKSLTRIGIEAVDLFYVHRREAERPIEEVTETLAGLVKKGKTRAIGFSEIAPASLRRAMAVHPVAAVQSEYSLATRSPELGLVQTCAELGVALVAFSPVGRSFLTDTPLSHAAVQDLPFLRPNPRFIEPNYSANIAATDRLRALAAEMGEPAAALAIAWVMAQGDHVLPIPGTRSVAHFGHLVRGAADACCRPRRSGRHRGGAAGGLGAWRPVFGGPVGRAGTVLLKLSGTPVDGA